MYLFALYQIVSFETVLGTRNPYQSFGGILFMSKGIDRPMNEMPVKRKTTKIVIWLAFVFDSKEFILAPKDYACNILVITDVIQKSRRKYNNS